MKAAVAALAVALSASFLLAGCGEMAGNSGCDLTTTSTKVASWPDDASRTKAEEHLKLAREAKDKKDAPACEQHRKDAEAALKM
jgi:ABC-type uncharacterized transport system auxiliary subunit